MIVDYFFTERIIKSKGIVQLFICFFCLIDQCDQKTVLQPKLDSFQQVVFIKREEFSYHAGEGFDKGNKMNTSSRKDATIQK